MAFKLAPRVFLQKVGNEAILMDTEGGTYFELNETGACFLQLIEDHDFESVLNLMCDRFHVSKEVLRDDLLSLVHDFQRHGLLETA